MIAGRYELDREIGRGGMGAVWLAQDTTLGREVAIKRLGLMPDENAGDERALRAEREARLAARLNHPHVVHVFDLVTEDETTWLVMEYVEGQTLAAMIRAEGALPFERASALLVQAADALAAAHAAGIVHRDVKPSNMLVTPRGEVKLSDFGIARAEADPSLTRTGLVTGSPAYLSPEVASGHLATTASDVWSLGATLYHALSGHPPYDVGENLMGALFRIVHEEPPRLSDAGWLAPLLEATMTTDPAGRWTMAQVRDFLASGGRTAGPAAPGSTQKMASVAATAPFLVDPSLVDPSPDNPPVEPAPTSSAPTPGDPGGGRGRRAWLLPLVVVAALVVVLGAVLWATLSGDDRTTPTIDRPPASATTSGSGRGQSDDPSDPGSSSSSPAAKGPTRAGMESFIADYLATAPDSPETGYDMLTPGFQRASGGFGGYSGFWTTIAEAEPLEIRADPESLVVDYVVAYTRQDGSEATGDVTLQLEFDDGRYLIADEA